MPEGFGGMKMKDGQSEPVLSWQKYGVKREIERSDGAKWTAGGESASSSRETDG